MARVLFKTLQLQDPPAHNGCGVLRSVIDGSVRSFVRDVDPVTGLVVVLDREADEQE
jgi:hypothetical protein